MKLKIIILAIILAIGFYFRADVLKLYPVIYQKIFDIQKANIPGFDKFKENLAQIIDKESRIFTPPPLRGVLEGSNAYLTQKGTIAETNLQRTENNLQPLKENVKLNAAAMIKAQDMFKNQYFEHISPSGLGPADLAKIAGYDYLIIGENLALGNFENDKVLVQAWMDSPGHRANILNDKYTEIGVAVKKGTYEGHSVWIAVQEFGRPVSDCPAIDESLKIKIENYNAQIDGMVKIIEAKKIELQNMDVTRKNISDYNALVNEFNNLIKQYNMLIGQAKAAIDDYNKQVRAFNECLK